MDPLAGTSLCFRSVLGTIRPLIGVRCHTAPMGIQEWKGEGQIGVQWLGCGVCSVYCSLKGNPITQIDSPSL